MNYTNVGVKYIFLFVAFTQQPIMSLACGREGWCHTFIDKDGRADIKLLKETKKKTEAQADFPWVSLLMLSRVLVTPLSY